MNALKNGVVLALMLGIIGLFVIPGGIFVARLMDTWTADYTGQLLGGFLGICGGSLAIVGVLVGAGLFARLAGWKAPRQPVDPPIDGDWRPLPPLSPAQQPTLPASNWQGLPQPLDNTPPPFGVTGGGNYDLLPPPKQDARYQMDTPAPRGTGKR